MDVVFGVKRTIDPIVRVLSTLTSVLESSSGGNLCSYSGLHFSREHHRSFAPINRKTI